VGFLMKVKKIPRVIRRPADQLLAGTPRIFRTEIHMIHKGILTSLPILGSQHETTCGTTADFPA
jgi:hypothetical protein